jgi:non-specific protein-tyrosine kinase
MKVRKALEKARKEREKGKVRFIEGGETIPEQTSWRPPVYGQSCRIEIDPAKLAENRCISIKTDDPAIDDYKVLRAQILQRARENGWRTVMITSPNAGDGKTVTAINLAITFAKEHDQTVLLVDADLKKQRIHHVMGYDSEWGLVDYLTHKKTLNDMIVWPCIEKLTVISGRSIVQESAELLASPMMKTLVEEMKTRYKDRYVIFDVPAVLDGADAMAFAHYVDGILMVIREGQTPIQDIKKALEVIPTQKFLGFALNRYSKR